MAFVGILLRWFNHIRAIMGNYFWLPCPICHRMFGGHERDIGDLMDGPGSGRIVCPNCANVAEERNKANGYFMIPK
jgi:hypothetical protein